MVYFSSLGETRPIICSDIVKMTDFQEVIKIYETWHSGAAERRQKHSF